MTPAYSESAAHNLRKGAEKMETNMTAAARVRREFRLGRPAKPETLPLHRTIIWQRATDALLNFRTRMEKAQLNPMDAEAVVVYVKASDPDSPELLTLEHRDKTPDVTKAEAFELLGNDDVIAIGSLFIQKDRQTGQAAVFPYLIVGLNERGMNVLKRAALEMQDALALMRTNG